VRVIPVRAGSFDHVLAARACVERGEVVAILADRSAPSGVQRDCSVAFLGGRAAIPQGPFRLAAALACPVLFMVALRTGDRAYSIDVELLANRIDLPRRGREQALVSCCQAYANRLARHCLRAPYQWFNFYDFFRDGVETPHE
jgi:predicted LPLAT superfamily acyltransferase